MVFVTQTAFPALAALMGRSARVLSALWKCVQGHLWASVSPVMYRKCPALDNVTDTIVLAGDTADGENQNVPLFCGMGSQWHP